MQLFDSESLTAYLRQSGHIAADDSVRVVPLSGGVSNRVFRVEFGDEGAERDFVVKQSQPQLATPDPWYCTIERIWNEVAVLQTCQRIVPAGQTPRVLFVDREEYLFGMSAAPREHTTWKAKLLAGAANTEIAAACGKLLGSIHRGAWEDKQAREQFADLEIFDTLRLDPYYRATARRFPSASPSFEALIESARTHRLCLVHADFSPKNLLVFDGGLMMVDFETGHFGDPAFDVGFFLSHLTLKTYHHAPRCEPFLELIRSFVASYRATMSDAIDARDIDALLARGVQHLAGCAWARIDGTSKVEYFNDLGKQEQVRELCRWIFAERPSQVADVVERIHADLLPAT